MSVIHLSRAIQAAFVLLGADICLNRGGTITGIAIGILGNWGIYTCREAFKEWRQRSYRVFPPLEFTYDDAAIKKTLAVIAPRFPKVFLSYKKYHLLFKQDEVTSHFNKKIKEGVCFGLLAALFKSSKINSEKTSYYQIMYVLKFHSEIIHPTYGTNLELSQMNLEDPICKLTHSDWFNLHDSVETYQSVFEAAYTPIAKGGNVFGVIWIPKHVIGIQFGPKGYFVYDSLNETKGLFKYSDKETFFSSLRDLVISDFCLIQSVYKIGPEAGVYYQFGATSRLPLSGMKPISTK